MKKDFICFIGMTKRNILVYLKDKITVFFSMLGPIIVLVLYLLFLKQNYVGNINNALKGLESFITDKDINAFINSWLISGILATSSITVSLNSLAIMVSDKERNIDYDYKAAPIRPVVVILSYFFGAFICTIMITGMVLIIGLGFLLITSSFYLSFVNVLKLFVVLIIGSLSSTIIMMIIVSFFKSSSAMGAFSGIVTAMVGFIIGAYIPISEFSNSVQSIANVVPGYHIAALFRRELMLPVLEKMNEAINGFDNGAFMKSMTEEFSFTLKLFNNDINPSVMYLYVIIATIIALGINIFLYRFSSKRK